MKGFQNGDLIEQARKHFDLLLTRDKDFTSEYLTSFVNETFSVVLLVIPQQRGADYATAFAEIWPVDVHVADPDQTFADISSSGND